MKNIANQVYPLTCILLILYYIVETTHQHDTLLFAFSLIDSLRICLISRNNGNPLATLVVQRVAHDVQGIDDESLAGTST
jgi:hypothetical protein